MKWFVAFCFLFGSLLAEAIEFIQDGPIHEAYVTIESGGEILQAAPIQPPKDIPEQIPPQKRQGAHWISGYWNYDVQKGDFTWVSGVWRVAPPGMVWIPGKWAHQAEGWVWVRGFWSHLPLNRLHYLASPPPDQLDESVTRRPNEHFFWVPGYWEYDAHEHAYIWYKGRWHEIDRNWQYTPAHYRWREEGYVYIPAFWDWPIEHRGVAYVGANIKPEQRATLTFEPCIMFDPLCIIEQLYPNWPSYASLFYHHFFYHMDLWMGWGAVPPWWHWDAWWTLSWQDQWWLFWWWTHPGYPEPFFLKEEVAAKMAPPHTFVLDIMKKQSPPPIVAANGVVGVRTLIVALEVVTGYKTPILPASPHRLRQVQEVAFEAPPPEHQFRPTGKGLVKEVAKPFFGPVHQSLSHPPRHAYVPPYPRVKPERAQQQPPASKYPPNFKHPKMPELRMNIPRQPYYHDD